MPTTKLDALLKDIPHSVWEVISQIDEIKGRWIGGAQLHPQILGRLKKSVLITSTGASTRIEGALLSDEDIEKMLRGISIQHLSDRDKQEVQGYFELLTSVFDSWASLHFSEGLIKHFHRELLKYVDKDILHRGDYKHQENKVHMVDGAGQSVGVLFDTTPAYLTPIQMQQLVEEVKEALALKKYHPLLIIGAFIVQFLHIHPFQDGNGRMSRVLTNLLLIQSGYPYVPYVSHEKYVEDNKPDYYLSLRTSQKTLRTSAPTIVPWLTFFLSIFYEQSKAALELITQSAVETVLSPLQLKVWQYIQDKQEVTPRELSEMLEIARPTINQILDKLLVLEKIKKLGEGRGTRYTLR